MSDSFNKLGATEFPCDAVRDMTVVKDYTGTSPAPTDEGRGMAELICFIAPGGCGYGSLGGTAKTIPRSRWLRQPQHSAMAVHCTQLC